MINTAIRVLLFYAFIKVGNVPPIGSSFRITDDNQRRIIDSGGNRVTDSN
jgi:hypothetical protein